MSRLGTLRQNWRVAALVVLLVLSAISLFAPGMGAGATGAPSADSGPTNLKYGLQLDGGTRIRAPVEGMTAEGVNVTQDNQLEIERTIASEMQLELLDVEARPSLNTVEVQVETNESAFRDALAAANLDPSTIRPGVTAPTRETIVQTISQKIDQTGFSGASVQQVAPATGGHYIVIEVPGANTSRVRELVSERGVVKMQAYYPTGNGTQARDTILTQGDFARIGSPTTTREGTPYVPVTLTDPAAERFANKLQQYGFTTEEGTNDCLQNWNETSQSQHCLLTVLDGEVVYSAGVAPGLANSIESGDFQENPAFRITATNMSAARELQINLQAGALPAALDIENGDVYYIAPSRAERFKPLSLLTGLIATLAVAGVVFLRYREPKVAAPMVVTALSEVVILLGFAAAAGLALDLSHIAGFIAVIGTGVDDLIIIADEVMAEQVSSRRVFQSRFKKALWIIGGAAATTIIAMSPLAVLSLGDLRGFAIVTILGVLIGVLVTRPAYGDILRSLLTEER
ncbi:preprotein translocase subunit SecD [Halospeciosus flavus]|uniref:Protein-export membrane protein SecD n=1 Tax=Halospeciosus flavus TaxID=3032283 RepID=A0ABD5Z8A3_9EURY|nr:preprotein translocase subunit SecD [Halospeciosus flavus]